MSRSRLGVIGSGYVLTVNGIVSSALGFLFWIVVAGRFSVGDLGFVSALVAGVAVVSGIGVVGLNSGLMRFLPVLSDWRSLVVRGYLAAGIATAILALAWALTLGSLDDGLGRLGSLGWAGLFLACCVVWTVFSLQDFVLIARGRATMVAAQNTLVAIARLALLFVPSVGSGALTIVLAWLLPTVVAIVAVNGVVLRDARPHAGAGAGARAREIVRYCAMSTAGSTASVLVVSLMPVIVASSQGVDANAAFFLPWTMATALQVVATSMAAPLLPALARGAGGGAAAVKRTMRHAVGAVGLLALPTFLLAPPVLGLLGREYEADSALLALLLAAAIVNAATAVLLTEARALSRTVHVAAAQWVAAIVLIGLALALLPALGVVGVGWAALAAQSCSLAVALRRPARRRAPATTPVAT